MNQINILTEVFVFFITFVVFLTTTMYVSSNFVDDDDDILPFPTNYQWHYDYFVDRNYERSLSSMDKHPVNNPVGTMPVNANYYHH